MPEGSQQLVATRRRILTHLARQRATVTYRELAQMADLAPPRTIHRTTEALEALMRENHDAGEALLPALVVSRGASGLPQRGFFMTLRALGRYDAWDYWAESPKT